MQPASGGGAGRRGPSAPGGAEPRPRKGAAGPRKGAAGPRKGASVPGGDGGLRRVAGALAAGAQRADRSRPVSELRKARRRLHLVRKRHHRIRRQQVRDSLDPRRTCAPPRRRALGAGASGQPVHVASRARISPEGGGGGHRPMPLPGVPAALRRALLPHKRPPGALPQVGRLDRGRRGAGALLQAHPAAARAVDLPAGRAALQPQRAGPHPRAQQQRAQRVRPDARAPVLAAPPAPGRHRRHAVGRADRQAEGNRGVRPRDGCGDVRPRCLLPARRDGSPHDRAGQRPGHRPDTAVREDPPPEPRARQPEPRAHLRRAAHGGQEHRPRSAERARRALCVIARGSPSHSGQDPLAREDRPHHPHPGPSARAEEACASAQARALRLGPADALRLRAQQEPAWAAGAGIPGGGGRSRARAPERPRRLRDARPRRRLSARPGDGCDQGQPPTGSP